MAARRSLWPREHGAYAQLAVPLLTALALRPPTVASLALAIAACLAFLANEPLLVMLGHRGARMRELLGQRAARRLRWLVVVGVALAVAGLSLAPHHVLVVAAVVAVPALAVIGLAWTRSEHSLAGEIVAAIALPGASVPVAVASGTSWQTAAWLWAAWSVGYVASVAGVHLVLSRHRRAASWRDLCLGACITGVALGACVLGGRIPLVWVSVPLLASGAVIAWRPPRAKQLRAVGVALVVASVLSSVIGVVATHSLREPAAALTARAVNVR